MSITAMKQALEALELALCSHGVMLLSDPPQDAWKTYSVEPKARDSITAIRTAIAEAEKQPTQRQWVGFTEEEISEYDYEHRDFIYDIEALLKHKNTRLG